MHHLSINLFHSTYEFSTLTFDTSLPFVPILWLIIVLLFTSFSLGFVTISLIPFLFHLVTSLFLLSRCRKGNRMGTIVP